MSILAPSWTRPLWASRVGRRARSRVALWFPFQCTATVMQHARFKPRVASFVSTQDADADADDDNENEHDNENDLKPETEE